MFPFLVFSIISLSAEMQIKGKNVHVCTQIWKHCLVNSWMCPQFRTWDWNKAAVAVAIFEGLPGLEKKANQTGCAPVWTLAQKLSFSGFREFLGTFTACKAAGRKVWCHDGGFIPLAQSPEQRGCYSACLMMNDPCFSILRVVWTASSCWFSLPHKGTGVDFVID